MAILSRSHLHRPVSRLLDHRGYRDPLGGAAIDLSFLAGLGSGTARCGRCLKSSIEHLLLVW